MTKFTDPFGAAVYIDLRRVLAISARKPDDIDPLAAQTYLWTSDDREDGYFGVQEPIDACLQAWYIVNSHVKSAILACPPTSP